ncbi:MAG: TonB-dependent receptor [Balneolaceae bacterium]
MFLNRYFQVFLLLLFIFPATEINAQIIEGVVRDAGNREPLIGANIIQAQTSNGTSTDEQGFFKLQLTEDGPDRITVSYLGYRTRTLTLEDEETDQPLEIQLRRQTIQSGEVFVQALRVDESNPIAYSNVTREDIERKNLGQDIPYLVSSTPSVVTTSDAGAGIGYTGIRIRGVDQARINVTINGIPLNDAESHGVWWVNMPDLASSVENIQIQRGVGSSTHGAGAFGATMNLQTARMEQDPYGRINTSAGSFNTRKYNVLLGSGRVGNGWQFEGRLSKIESDGYIDRASSDLKSFYLSGSREGEHSLLKADVFSGQERTYQAWNGVPEPILNNDPGQLEHYLSQLWITGEEADRMRDNLGNRRFNEYTYENQVDNYQQDHYQLHYSYQFPEGWLLNTSFHYTYGRGYYEQYRENDPLGTYNIEPIEMGGETIARSDLIRRRWLDNHFYGTVFSATYRSADRWNLTVGGGYNEYDGDHFGEVIWARFAGNSEHEDRYYDNNGFKTDFNLYGKFIYNLTDALSSYLDLQYRSVSYRFLGKSVEEVNGEQQAVDLGQQVQIDFFNPKAGLVYRLDNNQRLFASLSVGGKEPTRSDYVESTPDSRPKPERLFDYEAGYSAKFDRFSAGVNLYYMDYEDQLILTGAVNDVGAYVRENVADSYRAGIELQGSVRLIPQLALEANATFSRNKIPEYTRYLDNFDEGGQNTEAYENSDIAFSPGFISNVTLTYQTGGLTGALSHKYVSRQYLDNTQSESRSIDPYFIQDLRIGYSFDRIPYLSALSATLQVNNLLDIKYVSNGYTFGWIAGGEEQSFNYYYPQAGRNVLIKVQAGF